MSNSNELKRFTITAFKSIKDFEKNPSSQDKDDLDDKRSFTAQANPASFAIFYALQYDNTQAVGSATHTPKWTKNPPRKLAFEFIVDGTGAIPASDSKAPEFLVKQINKLETVVFKVSGKGHAPNYLRIEWGYLTFDCRLESMNITYKLFKPDGEPIRASINVSFFEVVRPDVSLKKINKQSPDVTHAFTVKEGDSLLQLAEEAYGDEAYYMAVAQSQKLIQFRNIQAGQRILFPPIQKNNGQ